MSKPLTPKLLEWAYSRGIFPMGMEDGSIEWFLPDSRAIIPLDGFHVNRSLRKSSRRFEVRFDTAFEAVISACARPEGTWITEDFVRVYGALFRKGEAHSAEAWRAEKLVGGVYGVALGGAFMAESMFHRETDAGKVALWRLIERLRASGFSLFDAQFMTPHLASLGAIEISHAEYMRGLAEAAQAEVRW